MSQSQTIIVEDGQGRKVTFTPWTNGYAVGFRVERSDGKVRYIYFNPSAGDNEPDFDPDVFVYHGDSGDPAQDRSLKCISIFSKG